MYKLPQLHSNRRIRLVRLCLHRDDTYQDFTVPKLVSARTFSASLVGLSFLVGGLLSPEASAQSRTQNRNRQVRSSAIASSSRVAPSGSARSLVCYYEKPESAEVGLVQKRKDRASGGTTSAQFISLRAFLPASGARSLSYQKKAERIEALELRCKKLMAKRSYKCPAIVHLNSGRPVGTKGVTVNPPASTPPVQQPSTPQSVAAKPPVAAGPTVKPATSPKPVTSPQSSPETTKRNPIPIPFLDVYEQKMKSFGKKSCDYLRNGWSDKEDKLSATYYDGAQVFFQIADYTKDTSYRDCAFEAVRTYRDGYVLPNNGLVAAYWNFTGGLTTDALRFGSDDSKAAVDLLATKAPFARDATQPSETETTMASRETAYAIIALLNNEKLGKPRRARLGLLVNHAIGHIDKWFITKDAPFVRPFMVGLTMDALVTYYERTGDRRILPAVKTALDGLWSDMWLSAAQSFKYTDRSTGSGGEEAAPDLNLLIAPSFAWYYNQTGDSVYQQRGDLVFSGGVANAFLSGNKQFNQNYLWSFRYIGYRSVMPIR
jgi:hypothetical protein